MSDLPFSTPTTQSTSFMGFRCIISPGPERSYAQDTENGVTQTLPSAGSPSTKYTIPKTGYWSFYAQMASFNQTILLEIRNGSTVILSGGSGGGPFQNGETTGVAYCQAGDVISITQGHANTVGARTDEGIPQFQAFYVGS